MKLILAFKEVLGNYNEDRPGKTSRIIIVSGIFLSLHSMVKEIIK